MDENQKYNIELREIVPEYHSKNKIVRQLFANRLKIALNYVKKVKPNKLIDIGCGDGSFI